MKLNFMFLLGLCVAAVDSAQAQLAPATPEQLEPEEQPEGRELDYSNDPLDDAAEVQLQQALNDIYNNYNSQISSLQGQVDTLASSGMQQCEVEANAAKSQAEQAAKEAKTQAMMGMLEPGAKTLGHLVEAGMGAAGSEKKDKEAELNKVISNCQSTGQFDCSKTGAEVTMAAKTKCAGDSSCLLLLNGEADRITRRISEINKELKDLGGATNELIGSGMQLAASGIAGSMAGKTAEENAALQKAAAEQSEELCKMGVQNQINELNRQIAQLEQAKARDLLMANMQAEYQTKLRREALEGELLEDDPTIDYGSPVALNDPTVNDPFIPPIRTVGDNDGSSGDEGAASPASGAASSPSGGGAPAWGFGGGNDANQGGNALPPQPKAAKYAGTPMSAANSAKGGFGSGFGTLDKKEEGEGGDRSIASVQEVGDGGLRVLLARTSMVHSRHAPTLVKGIDFKKLAQAMPQNKTPKRAAASSPATRN